MRMSSIFTHLNNISKILQHKITQNQLKLNTDWGNYTLTASQETIKKKSSDRDDTQHVEKEDG